MKDKIITSLLVVALILGGYGAVKSSTVIEKTINTEKKTLGAFPGTDILAPELNFNGIKTAYRAGAFLNGTTTLAAILNPFNATATVKFASVYGTNGTTSINLLVGTSTVASPTNNASQISASLINATVATSAPFYTASGALAGPGQGHVSAGASTQNTIVLGPSEYVVFFATSTSASYATGLEGITGNSNTFTGNYEIEIKR